MRCPFCGHEDTQVKDSRSSEDESAIRRRRWCNNCGARFTTYERIQLRDLVVVKKNGTKQAFDRDKLYRSMMLACRKRPVTPERLDQVVSGLVRRLESMGESEIPAEVIGEIVLTALANLDQVAFVRYASVYRNFRDGSDFLSFINNMANLRAHPDGSGLTTDPITRPATLDDDGEEIDDLVKLASKTRSVKNLKTPG